MRSSAPDPSPHQGRDEACCASGLGRCGCGEASGRGTEQDRGVLSLEFALAVPVLLLAVLVALHAVGLGRDALLAQTAAREGARAAATTRSLHAVRTAVDEVLGGRASTLTVRPPRWQAGQLVEVTVTIRTRLPVGPRYLTATAAARAEPVVGR